jgi:hypothetical protein
MLVFNTALTQLITESILQQASLIKCLANVTTSLPKTESHNKHYTVISLQHGLTNPRHQVAMAPRNVIVASSIFDSNTF